MGTGEVDVMETLPRGPAFEGVRPNEVSACSLCPGMGQAATLEEQKPRPVTQPSVRNISWLPHDFYLLNFPGQQSAGCELRGVLVGECHTGKSCLMDSPAKLSLPVPAQEQREQWYVCPALPLLQTAPPALRASSRLPPPVLPAAILGKDLAGR